MIKQLCEGPRTPWGDSSQIFCLQEVPKAVLSSLQEGELKQIPNSAHICFGAEQFCRRFVLSMSGCAKPSSGVCKPTQPEVWVGAAGVHGCSNLSLLHWLSSRAPL